MTNTCIINTRTHCDRVYYLVAKSVAEQSGSRLCVTTYVGAQSRGADPTVKTENYDPYLNPGRKLPTDVAIEEGVIRSQLISLQVPLVG